MENAIKKAKEGGYFWNSECEFVCVASHYSNPDFWKCLGKACGWNPDWTTCHVGCQVKYNGEGCDHDLNREGNYRKPIWQYHWHCFIDHLAEGKDAESFFNELLK